MKNHPASTSRHSLLLAVAMATTLLSACGGSDDPAPPAGGAGGGGNTLTISAANPAAQNTTIDLATASTAGNDARPADGFSAAAYCEVFFEGPKGANGKTYGLQVYFRQSDKQPLHASLVEGPAAWVVFQNNSGNPITGITVDTTARTLNFGNKVLNGSAGEVATLSGTVSFPKNATVAACGA